MNTEAQKLKIEYDLKGVIDTASDDGETSGEKKGILKGILQVAKALKATGISIEIISKTTGLSTDEIENL